MKRRAQVALEFLTTYGWMFLVVGAVFGAMAYFGVGNLRDSVPVRCDFGFDFNCGAVYANESGTFVVQLKNTQAKGVYLNRTICQFPSIDDRILNTYTDEYVPAGQDIVLECDPALLGEDVILTSKQLFNMKVIYEYNESGALPNIANGELVIQTVEGPLPATYTAAITSGTESVLPAS